MTTQSYQLQLGEGIFTTRYIITDGEWFRAERGWTGVAIIYPEHDLLWICDSNEKTERFKTLENFTREFSSLPRWEATRYAVIEAPAFVALDGHVFDVDLFPFDCRTGEMLLDHNRTGMKAVRGRQREVERLFRATVELMRGECFGFGFM